MAESQEVRHDTASTTSSPGPAGALAWKLLSAGAAVLATKAAMTVAQKGWTLATGKSVPSKSDYDSARTRDVVAYTALSTMLLTGAKVAAERKAAEYYRHSSGHLPKALVETKPTKKEKKARKKAEKARKKAEQQAQQTAAS